jgi:hypothetical protein
VASVPAGDEFGKAKLASFFCCLAQLAMDKAVRDEISEEKPADQPDQPDQPDRREAELGNVANLADEHVAAILGRWDGKRGENGRDGTSCEKVVGAAV